MTGGQTAHQSAGYRSRFGTAIQVFYMAAVRQPLVRCGSPCEQITFLLCHEDGALQVLDRIGQVTISGGVDHLLGFGGHLDAHLVESFLRPTTDLPRIAVGVGARAGTG